MVAPPDRDSHALTANQDAPGEDQQAIANLAAGTPRLQTHNQDNREAEHEKQWPPRGRAICVSHGRTLASRIRQCAASNTRPGVS